MRITKSTVHEYRVLLPRALDARVAALTGLPLVEIGRRVDIDRPGLVISSEPWDGGEEVIFRAGNSLSEHQQLQLDLAFNPPMEKILERVLLAVVRLQESRDYLLQQVEALAKKVG